jgi:hypothetical protein
MSPDNDRPAPDQVADLKRLAAGIIRAQGNRFIKELLRDKGIRIGVTKDDFERNLTAAIENGELGLADVDAWLKSVEGWGNQHVYLYNLSPRLLGELTAARLRRKAGAAGYGELWGAPTVLEFPEAPRLTSISFADSVLRVVWQESSPGWTPVPDRNYQEEEGLDTFEFRAFRRVERRAITRFEARVEEGLAGLFISDPIQGEEHQQAVAEARRVIRTLMDLDELDRGQVDISVVSRNLDQRNVPAGGGPSPPVKTQKSRLASGGAYVEFAASSRDKAYWEEPAIKDVRKSVRNQQLHAFQGTGGVFVMQEGFGAGASRLRRPLRVQLYGKTDRVRLWAQMDTDEVWTILASLSTYQ